MRPHRDRETTLELALECLAKAGYLRLRVIGDTHCDPPLNPGQIVGVLNQVEEPRRVSWLRRIARFA